MPVQDSQLLVDIWSDESLNSISKVLLHNTTTSIGPILWDNANVFSEAASSLELYPQQSEPVVSSEDLSVRRRRNNMVNGKLSAKMLYYELTKGANDPHLLVAPYYYGEEIGPVPDLQQPFGLVVHPQVALTCDLHGHLSDAEVIGLLAGKWDANTRTLYIQAAFPCTSTNRSSDDGSTDVELDAEAEFQVRNAVEKLGMVVVGWYHSHPLFKPDPSITDLFNQHQYQQLMRDDASGCEPFVGLIVSTFDKELPTEAAKHQWFCVTPYTDADGGARQIIQLPLILNAQYRSLAHDGWMPNSSDVEEVIALLDSLTVSPRTPITKSPKEEEFCCDSKLLCEEVSVKSGRGGRNAAASVAASEGTAASAKEKKNAGRGTKATKGAGKAKIIPVSKKKVAQLCGDATAGEALIDAEAVSVTVSTKSKAGKRGGRKPKSENAKSDVSSDSFPLVTTATSVEEVADPILGGSNTAVPSSVPTDVSSGLMAEAGATSGTLQTRDSIETSSTEPEGESVAVKEEPPSTVDTEVFLDPGFAAPTDETTGDVPLLIEHKPEPKKKVVRKKAIVAVPMEPRMSQRERKPRMPLQDMYLSGNEWDEETLVVLPAKRKRKATPFVDETEAGSDAPSKRKSVRKSSVSSTDADTKSTRMTKVVKKGTFSVADPRHFSLILSLQDREFESADLARQLLSGVAASCRFVTLIIISLGFYYSRRSPRIDLTKKWKLVGTKFDKIRASVAFWTGLLGVTSENNCSFLDALLGFLESSWREYSKGVTRSKGVDIHGH